MKLNTLVFFVGLLFLSAGLSFAENWDKVESQFYSALKDTQGDHSAAELEQAMGFMFLEKDQWQRASIHYKKAVKLDPTLFNSWYNLGLIFIDDKQEGNGYFRRAIKANPDYPPPYYWLAYNFCKAGKDKEAVPIFKQYVEIATKIGDPQEADRIKYARALLKEISSGKDGEELKAIREFR